MYKYCPIYLKGATPIIEEDDIFKLTIRYEEEKQEFFRCLLCEKQCDRGFDGKQT